MATLGTVAFGSWWGTRGGDKKKEAGPAYNATSQEEEKFIKSVYHLHLACSSSDIVRWSVVIRHLKDGAYASNEREYLY